MGDQLGFTSTGGVSKAAQDWEGPKQINNVCYLEAFTAADTLTKEESGKVCTNLGASGAVTLTLPQDAPKGCCFHIVVQAAQELRVDPGAAGAIYINGAKQTDDKYISADDEGESTMLVADGNGDWVSCHTNGTWSVEA